MTKRCPHCGEMKSHNEFGRNKGKRKGLRAYCRPCKRELDRIVNAKRRDKIRAWEREHSTPCVDCGKLTSDGYRSGDGSKPGAVRCLSCESDRRHEEAFQRTKRYLAMRREGMANYEIAEAEGVTPGVIANTLQRSRVARFPLLVWLPAPYAVERGQVAV